MQRDPRAFLWDVQQAADAITRFTADLDTAGYRANPLAQHGKAQPPGIDQTAASTSFGNTPAE
jgi:hypothetical protein